MRIVSALLLSTLLLLQSCSNSNVSGGGAEAGNGYIAGSITIAGSDYTKDCKISLFPQNYSPFTNDSGKEETLSDENGNFSFKNLLAGTYSIHIKSADRNNSILGTIYLQTDNDSINSQFNLKKSSTVKLTLNSVSDSGWYFIEGTDIKGAVTLDSLNKIVITGLPSDTVKIRFYPESLFTDQNIPESIYTSPGDTVDIADNYKWTHIDSKNSPLPHDYIYSLLILDNKQYWGTYYGYLEITGQDTTLFDMFNTTLPSSWIKKLYQSSDNALWVLNNNGAAINKFGSWSNIYPDSFGIVNQEVFDLCEINDTTVLLAVSGGILKVTPYDTTFDTTFFPTTCSAMAINMDSEGSLFFGTYGSGLHITKGSVKDSVNNTNSSLAMNNIQTLFVDSRDTLWIGTFGGGLYKYKDILEAVEGEFTDSIYSIMETSDGSVWTATSTGDLVKYHAGEISVLNSSNSPLPANALLTLATDKFDRLYIGTYSKGLYILEEY